LLVFIAGCGHIDYGPSSPQVAQPAVAPAYAVATPVPMAAPAPAQPRAQDGVVYVPWDPGAQPQELAPPPAPIVESTPAPSTVAGNAPIQCAGNQRLRVDGEILDGHGGPAVIATDGCVVEVSESILRGEPASLVRGRARALLVECRIDGDLRSAGSAQIETRGSRHDRGRVTRF